MEALKKLFLGITLPVLFLLLPGSKALSQCLNYSITDVSCNGGSDGTVTITINLGTAPYNFTIFGEFGTIDRTNHPSNTYTFTNLPAEPNLIIVGQYWNAGANKFNSCPPQFAAINEPNALDASASITNNVCNGGNIGAINLTASGGTPPYSYSWSNGTNTEDISGLVAGTYTVTITDFKNCTVTLPFTVTEPSAISSSAAVSNVTCNGANDGSIDLTPNGGTPGYTYLWSNGAITEDISGLSPGLYSVSVTDANGCTHNNSFNITEPTPLTANGVTTDVTCNGGSNGSINLTAGGGTSPYTYLWSNGAVTEDLSGVTAGNYFVTVTDANGCIQNVNFTINEPAAININGTPTDVLCFGGNNGSINITVVGGTAGYTFAWSNGTITEDIAGLTAGNYSVTVTDANGCSQNSNFNVNQPALLTLSASITDASCTGLNNGSIDLTVNGGVGPYTYSWSNGAISQDIATLVGGTYNVTVTDANGCQQNGSYTVNQPSVMNITNSNTNVSCNGGNNGAINITVGGGTPGYTYLWSNGIVTEDASGLTAGNYSVTVTDAAGCSQTSNYTITQPALALTSGGTTTDVTCNGGSNGAINLTANGGTAPYSYLWNNGAITEDVSGLAAGNYSVTVTDANGCTSNSNFTINQPLAIVINGNTTDVSCNGGNNGAIDITVNGGVPGYTYLWSNSANTEDINGLASGNYSVTVTDANGCIQNTNFTINQPLIISINGNTTDVSCNGGNNGAIDITVNGGTPGYTYLWNNGAVTQDVNALVQGNYSVTVTDANGCQQNANFTINEPISLSISGASTDAICNGGNSGSINLTASGGTLPYTYLWSNGANTEDINSLAAGNYSVTVTDANGCSQNANFTVNEPTVITVNGATTDATCTGINNGAINITVNGGTPGYTYVWSNGANTEDISSLAGGNYTVTVTDANGCTQNAIFTVNQPAPVAINGNIIDATCNGGSNGSIDITVAGGSPGYTYLWSNGAASEDINSLTAGNYTVTVTDANGCQQNANFTVNEPLAITINGNVTDVGCNGASTGAIDITVTNGVGALNYVWSNGAITEDINSLAAGNYSVTVTDANGCSNNANFTINEATPVSVNGTASDVTCNGGNNGSIDLTISGGTAPYGTLWSNGAITEDITNLTAGNYSVIVTDANGCISNANFTINEPLPISIIGNTTDVTCNGGSNGAIDITVSGGTGPYTYSWDNGAIIEDITSLTAGNYTVTVTDANGCINNGNFIINEPSAITITGLETPASCSGITDGAVNITVNGGVAPYGFSWDNGASSEDLTNVASGSYNVTVTDANGCTQIATFNVTEPVSISLNANVTNALCQGVSDGAIDLSVTGGTGPFTYVWSNGSASEDISNLANGSYTVTVTDANGCNQNATFDVTVTQTFDLTITLTSPTCNGDNDGAINLEVNNGVGPFNYAWSTGEISQDLNGLPTGSYTVTITDTNTGCFGDSTITLTEPAALDVTADFASPICATGNSGQVTLDGTGGTAPYQYSDDNVTFQASNIFGSLAPGNYTFYIRDNNGCTDNVNATLNAFPQVDIAAINANIINLTCNGVNTGQVHLSNITGGTRPYTFSLNGGTPQSDSSFIGLGAANHIISIGDANGCSYNYNFNITSPPAIDFNLTLVQFETCNNADGIFNLSNISGGLSPYRYSFDGAAAVNYPGGTITFNNLIAKSYSVTVYDNSVPGCSQTKNIIIPKKPGPIPFLTINNIQCFGGSDGQIVIDSIEGGAPNFDITINALSSTYTATHTNIGANSTVLFPFLALDNYGMTITDQECTYPIGMYYLWDKDSLKYDTIIAGNFPIMQPTPLDVDVFTSNTDRHLNIGTALFTNFTGGTPPYFYSTDNVTYFPVVNDSVLISGLDIGTYVLYTRDNNGCANNINYNIGVGLYIPNLITPNEDGHNDYFEIIALPAKSELKIFNKWGGRVYYSEDYDNTWDGHNEPAGVYFYELHMPNHKLYKGWIEIVR